MAIVLPALGSRAIFTLLLSQAGLVISSVGGERERVCVCVCVFVPLLLSVYVPDSYFLFPPAAPIPGVMIQVSGQMERSQFTPPSS